MSVIGIRASSAEIRYALLDYDSGSNAIFLNKSSENCIRYPATISKVEEKVEWAKAEMDRVYSNHSDIQRAYIKINEYLHDTAANREASYMVAAFLLSSREHEIPVEMKINSQIGSKSATSKQRAENFFGKTEKYWNNAMADAILVAYWGLQNGA